MTIIEEHHNHEKEVTCENCGSRLGYSNIDIKWERNSPWEFVKTTPLGTRALYRREISYLISCPVCHSSVIVESYDTEQWTDNDNAVRKDD